MANPSHRPGLDTPPGAARTSGSRIAVALFTRIIFSFVLNFRHEKRDAESIPFLMPKIQDTGEDYASKKIHSDPAAHRHRNRAVPGGVIFLFKKAESRLAQ